MEVRRIAPRKTGVLVGFWYSKEEWGAYYEFLQKKFEEIKIPPARDEKRFRIIFG